MARFNEILVGRFNRALQKTFGMKGGPPSAQLATEIQPNVNMFWGVEQRYLEGWGRFGVSTTQVAGGAGNRSAFRFRNPAASGFVAVIEKLLVSVALADQPFVTVSTTAATADLTNTVITANSALDNRGSQSPGLSITASGAAIIVGIAIAQVSLPAVANYDFLAFEEQELTILPGSSYTLYSNVLNQALNFSMFWRERVLEDSEKT